MSHPFGNLLTHYRARKHGLTQARLAQAAGYDASLITKMCQGRKELTGPSGRERVVRLMTVLRDEGVLATREEANALLKAAGMPPLYADTPLEAVLLRRLQAMDAPAPFRDASPPAPRRTNLPAPVTRFIGRERQVANLTRKLQQCRLLTLTGAGGIGKTRLALEIGRACAAPDGPAPAFPDGVWLVELAPIADPARVAETILATFELPQQPDRAPMQTLSAYLAARRLLLILDNCEHMIGACAELAEQLLQACPELRILATSREALRSAGEVAWRVPSLTAPDPAHQPALEHLLDYEAVTLFVEHAAARRADFALAPDSIRAIGHICQRLDGIALAIEMAAAQVGALAVGEIAAALDDHFALAMPGRRTAAPRQRTLRATLDWSYALLSEAERVLLARLSVFAGGWTAEMAQAACADDSVGAPDGVPLLMQLVNKSLVVATQHNEQTRFSMLEMIREYAREKLVESGELALMQHRHANACLSLAQAARPQLTGRGHQPWMERLEYERDNMRAALTWCFGAAGDAVLGLLMVAALVWFWSMSGSFNSEALQWVQEALHVPSDVAPPAARATVLQSSYGTADQELAHHEEALHLFRSVGDQEGIALALVYLGQTLDRQGDLAGGKTMIEEGVVLSRKISRPWITTEGLLSLALIARVHENYDYERADMLLDECYQLARQMEHGGYIGATLKAKADIALQKLDYIRAVATAEEMLTLARAGHDWLGEYWAILTLAVATRLNGDARRAVEFLEGLLAQARGRDADVQIALAEQILGRALNELGDSSRAKSLLMSSLQSNLRISGADSRSAGDLAGLACVASSMGTPVRAARLFGASDAILAACHWQLEPWAQVEYAPYIARARESLGADAFAAAWAEGGRMTPEQAVAYAQAS